MAGRDLKFVKQSPSFIKNFKSQIGYKEPDDINSKFNKLEKSTKEDGDDLEGELPSVVLGTNVTEEEAKEFFANRSADQTPEVNEHATEAIQDSEQKGKIVFKKPKKRKSEDKPPGICHKKRPKDSHTSELKSSSKAIKNTSLLSFGNEEDDD